MPVTSRYFIKTGLLFFILAMVLGVLSTLNPELSIKLRPFFWHSLMVGWITQIIIGVSLWMFPGRSRTEDYRSQFLSWLIYFSLNTGLLLRIIFEPFSNSPRLLVISALIVSAFLHIIASFSYFLEMWPRVVSKEKQLKNRRLKKGST
ncbi:MAG: hypothetical protein RLN90_04260 [Balneolaceae bacterium]